MLKLPLSCKKNKDLVLANIWREIQSGVLSGKGSAFSFEYKLHTEMQVYTRNLNTKNQKWKLFNKEKLNNRIQFELMLMKFGSGISFSRCATCYSDERNGSNPYALNAYVRNGFTYTINVSDAYARYIFQENYAGGLAFCDHLLIKRQDLLVKIVEENKLANVGAVGNHDINYAAPRKYDTFTVKCGEIVEYYTSNDGDRFSISRSFSEYGMGNLQNIQECYGMALALAKIVCEKKKINSKEINIEFLRKSEDSYITDDNLDGITVVFTTIEKQSIPRALNAW